LLSHQERVQFFPITEWHRLVKAASLQQLTCRILCRIEGRAINAAMLFSTCIVKLFKAEISNKSHQQFIRTQGVRREQSFRLKEFYFNSCFLV